jgi:hypothetical protein
MAIASCLVDTNILLRMTRRSDPEHAIVSDVSRFSGISALHPSGTRG